MAEVQDTVNKMIGLLALLVSIFLIGNSVSDPSSLIQTLESLNRNKTMVCSLGNTTTLLDRSNSTGSAGCTARHLVGHFKTLAYEVHFLLVSLALAAGLVYAVKITVDKGAKAEEEARATEATAASEAADKSKRCAEDAAKAMEESDKAQDAEGHANLTAGEKRSVFNEAVMAASIAETTATDAKQALQAAAAELEIANAAVQRCGSIPGADTVAAESKALAAARAADDAATAAAVAEENAAKATEHLQATTASLKQAADKAKTKKDAAISAEEAADEAKRRAAAAAADAAKPAVGIARFPRAKRVFVRFTFSEAIVVSFYSSMVAISSFRELLRYKTDCLQIDNPVGLNKPTVISTLLPVTHWMLVAVFGYLHLGFLWVAIREN